MPKPHRWLPHREGDGAQAELFQAQRCRAYYLRSDTFLFRRTKGDLLFSAKASAFSLYALNLDHLLDVFLFFLALDHHGEPHPL